MCVVPQITLILMLSVVIQLTQSNEVYNILYNIHQIASFNIINRVLNIYIILSACHCCFKNYYI